MLRRRDGDLEMRSPVTPSRLVILYSERAMHQRHLSLRCGEKPMLFLVESVPK